MNTCLCIKLGDHTVEETKSSLQLEKDSLPICSQVPGPAAAEIQSSRNQHPNFQLFKFKEKNVYLKCKSLKVGPTLEF